MAELRTHAPRADGESRPEIDWLAEFQPEEATNAASRQLPPAENEALESFASEEPPSAEVAPLPAVTNAPVARAGHASLHRRRVLAPATVVSVPAALAAVMVFVVARDVAPPDLPPAPARAIEILSPPSPPPLAPPPPPQQPPLPRATTPPSTQRPLGSVAAIAEPRSSPGASRNPPPAPTVPSPVRAAAAATGEAAEVDAVLDGYRRAFNALNVERVRQVWPRVDGAALDRAFRGLATQTLEFDDCQVRPKGSEALAVCHGRATSVPKIGGRAPQVESREWQFTLTKTYGRWLITAVESKR